MASINYAVREISIKVVYYGPGLSGKTTNLQVIHRKIPLDYRSDMVSLATETDRTLFFDFLPLDLGKIKGFSTKFQLYTVPGQVYYNATRKLVLRGVDGVVFVVDSAQDKMQENLESLQNLHDNLAEYGYPLGSVPIVLQYNKRDLPNALPIDQLDKIVNKHNYPFNEACASQGKGVFESLKIIGKIVIDTLNKKYSRPSYGSAAPQAAAPQRPPMPAPAPQQHAPTPFVAPMQAPPQRPPMQQPPQRPQPQQQQFSPPPQDIFAQPMQQRQSPQPAYQPPPPQQRPPVAPIEPQQEQASGDYYDYAALDLEPLMQQTADVPESDTDFSAVQPQQPPVPEKTELDLEIERYQREIEEKQQRLRSLQSSSQGTPHAQVPPPQQTQQFQQQVPMQPAYNAPEQEENYADVYTPPETQQIPQYSQQENNPDVQVEDDDQSMYFTSVNPDMRKKIKRPVNPKNKPQGGFLKNMFNKDKPE